MPCRLERAGRAWACAAAAALLAACGGGGGNPNDGPGATPPAYQALAQQCAPNNPLAEEGERIGTLETEQRWIKAFMDERYYWYSEIPDVNPADGQFNTADVPESLVRYFNALRTRVRDANNRPKDNGYSRALPTQEWEALIGNGMQLGFGIEWVTTAAAPPRKIRIAFVEPDSPAERSGLERGMTLLTVDGVEVDDDTPAGEALLAEATTAPVRGQSYRLVFRDADGDAKDVLLTAQPVEKKPVQGAAVLTTPTGLAGYLAFHDHVRPAEDDLIAAFENFADRAVQEVIIDLRYNSGGLTYLASQLAFMVAGTARTDGRLFERLVFNDKRRPETDSAEARTPFLNSASGLPDTGTSADTLLPTLDLNRVYVLTGPGTCSASETLINGLRGVEVEVVVIGATTCGQPYGSVGASNCGLTYLPVEYNGQNDIGFGDYTRGFAPTCAVADDLSQALGSRNENVLAAALTHIATGACPAAASAVGQEVALPLRAWHRKVGVVGQ